MGTSRFAARKPADNVVPQRFSFASRAIFFASRENRTTGALAVRLLVGYALLRSSRFTRVRGNSSQFEFAWSQRSRTVKHRAVLACTESQLSERCNFPLAKVGVEGSNPFARSKFPNRKWHVAGTDAAGRFCVSRPSRSFASRRRINTTLSAVVPDLSGPGFAFVARRWHPVGFLTLWLGPAEFILGVKSRRLLEVNGWTWQDGLRTGKPWSRRESRHWRGHCDGFRRRGRGCRLLS